MTEYENNEKANKLAEGWRKYIVWGFVPIGLAALWFYVEVVSPIVCALKAGCGVASW